MILTNTLHRHVSDLEGYRRERGLVPRWAIRALPYGSVGGTVSRGRRKRTGRAISVVVYLASSMSLYAMRPSLDSRARVCSLSGIFRQMFRGKVRRVRGVYGAKCSATYGSYLKEGQYRSSSSCRHRRSMDAHVLLLCMSSPR